MESHHHIDATSMDCSQVAAASITAGIQGQQSTQHGRPCRAQAGDLGIVGNVGLERARQACRPSMRVACERSQGVAQTCRHASRYSSNGMPTGAVEGSRLQRASSGRYFTLPQRQDRRRPIVRSRGGAVSGSAPACLAVAIGVQHGCECTTALLCWKSQSQYPASWVHESA